MRDAAVREATERWAHAAGVSPSVARGMAPTRRPVAVRLLRGALLGAAFGALLLLLASSAGTSTTPWVLLVVALGLLVVRIGGPGRRSHRRTAASGR
ncbi:MULTISPECIES: hypothetical protein [unclassified Blastococcus]